jgi:dihydrodipicolinate synthase/N-acetylneuraminate lyase
MKTTSVTTEDLSGSVIAVPPLARHADLRLNEAENRRMVTHLVSGGVTTVLWGGNANLYNVGVDEYRPLCEMIEAIGDGPVWMIPSAGPDYGKLIDQARILRDFAFPTAMILPLGFPATQAGSERAIRDFVQTWGRPATLYVKAEKQLRAEQIARLVDAGDLCAVKYAVPRPDFTDDPLLAELVTTVGRGRLVSGMGERPAVDHLRTYGLAGFTSGCVTIAPRAAMLLLGAIARGDWAEAALVRAKFLPMEDLREAINMFAVLHDAVTFSGVADMGPMLPCLSNLEAKDRPAVEAAARTLLAYNDQLLAAAAAE